MNFIDNKFKSQDDLSKKIDEYKAILKNDKNNILALSKLAYIYKNLHNYYLAGKYYLQIKFLTPFDKQIYYELGLIEYEKGNPCKAIKNFIQAIKLYPEYYDAYFALAKAHELCDEYEMAEMIYIKIIEANPKYFSAYNQLADLYMYLGNYTKATRYYRELLAINPEYYSAYLGLAEALEQKGQINETKKYYKKYLELKPFCEERKYILNKLQSYRQKEKIKTNSNNKFLVLLK